MQHIVKKQILEIDLDQKLDGFRMQHEIAGFNQYGIIQVLEKVFDEISSEDTVTAIERLEIDLGLITVRDLEKKSANNIYEKISLLVREAVSNSNKVKHDYAPNNVHPVVHSLRVLSIARKWLFYMEHGYLSWNTISINETWYKQVLEAFAVDFESTTELRRLILSNQHAVKRIIYQHQEIFLQQLMEILTAKKQTDLLLLIDKLTKISSVVNKVKNKIPDSEIIMSRERVWILLLGLAARGEIKSSGQIEITEEAIRQILKEDPLIEDIITSPNEKIVTARVPQTNDDGIFVQHAGLVLLHPFLHSFFKRLQLMEQTEFVSAVAHQKAVLILYYLSTGLLLADEYELVIPKLLCGFTFEETVPMHIELNEREISEANNLLEAAIAQWEMLKNTSATGLREGFLQRNGKLFTKNDSQYLQLETSSIDILLDYLPWNLSIIKLPWMKDILRVEWR